MPTPEENNRKEKNLDTRQLLNRSEQKQKRSPQLVFVLGFYVMDLRQTVQLNGVK